MNALTHSQPSPGQTLPELAAAPTSSRLESGVLWALLGFTLVSTLGYWNFALHPERLPADDLALLGEHTEVLHIFTPEDFETELNATQGNAFAIEPRFTQTAWFRPQNRSEDVDDLYLVGAGTHPGAGVPGVLLSAEATYGCIAEDRGLPDQWDWDQPGRSALEPRDAAVLAD